MSGQFVAVKAGSGAMVKVKCPTCGSMWFTNMASMRCGRTCFNMVQGTRHMCSTRVTIEDNEVKENDRQV